AEGGFIRRINPWGGELHFSNLGLSAVQMGVLIAIWPLSSLLFEIPTGAIADIYGRKTSVLIGYILEGLAMLSFFIFKDYYSMLFSFAFLGFAQTFSSGSKEAWIVDLIKKKNNELMHSYFSKTFVLGNFGLIVSGLLGAFAVKSFGLSSIWIAAFFSFIISGLFLLFAGEHFAKRKVNISNSFKKIRSQIKESLKYSYSHHVLFYFLIATFVMVFALNFQTNLSWIPLLKELGMQEHQFGYLWTAISASVMLSQVLPMAISPKGRERKFIIFGIAISSAILIFVAFANNIFFAMGVLLLSNFFFFAVRPAERVYFHKFIPSKLRATIGSVESMLISIASIVSLPIAGAFIDKFGARYAILASVALMIPAVILYLRIREDLLVRGFL
ncbi:MAG: MFS transporter, partial [Nanoarchaeota archaeon]